MRNYFVNMVFPDIVSELISIDELPENQDLQNLGHKMILIACMIVQPDVMPKLNSAEEITLDIELKAKEVMLTPEFTINFNNLCQMDVIPEIDVSFIKHIKLNFIDILLTNNADGV